MLSEQDSTAAATRCPKRWRMVSRVASPTLILDCIMQQGCDCLILVAASLKHQRAHAHQVGNVGDGDTFSMLLVMQTGGELQGKIKSPRQKGDVWLHAVILASAGQPNAPPIQSCPNAASRHIIGYQTSLTSNN